MATSSADRAAARQDRWATVQGAALVVGAVFVLVGILGFIPGATDYGSGMKAAGHASGAMLLHLFQVSILHNIVYLLFGVAGLLMARTINGARTFLVDGGIIYLVLWVYGLLIKSDSAENFPPVNTADNWLHFALGAGMVLLWSWSTANATPVLTGWRLPYQFSADDLRAERAALDLRRILADCLRIDCAISRVSRALRRVAAAWVRIAVRFAARSRSRYAFWRQAPEQ